MDITDVRKRSEFRPVMRLSFLVVIQLAFCFVVVTACSTAAVKTKSFNRPYGVVRATVQKAMPLGVRTTSRNGRTFESQYFIPRGSWDEEGSDAKERAFARATVLGSGRPYSVEVTVFRQTKKGAEYSSADVDDDLSERLAKKIEDDIANRREDRNIIDDFKPF